MFRVAVMYPYSEGCHFDHEYYEKKHMALVHEKLDSYGLVRTEIDQGLGGGAPGSAAPFAAIGYMVFEKLEDFQTGFPAVVQDLGADVPNYTDIQPQIQISRLIS